MRHARQLLYCGMIWTLGAPAAALARAPERAPEVSAEASARLGGETATFGHSGAQVEGAPTEASPPTGTDRRDSDEDAPMETSAAESSAEPFLPVESMRSCPRREAVLELASQEVTLSPEGHGLAPEATQAPSATDRVMQNRAAQTLVQLFGRGVAVGDDEDAIGGAGQVRVRMRPKAGGARVCLGLAF